MYVVGKRYRIVSLEEGDDMEELEDRLRGQVGVLTVGQCPYSDCLYLKLDNWQQFMDELAFARNISLPEEGACFLDGIVLKEEDDSPEMQAWIAYDQEEP